MARAHVPACYGGWYKEASTVLHVPPSWTAQRAAAVNRPCVIPRAATRTGLLWKRMPLATPPIFQRQASEGTCVHSLGATCFDSNCKLNKYLCHCPLAALLLSVTSHNCQLRTQRVTRPNHSATLTHQHPLTSRGAIYLPRIKSQRHLCGNLLNMARINA